jgi:hypothetical protein
MVLVAGAVAASGAVWAAGEAPDWVESARKRPLFDQAAKADLVVLHSELLLDVSRSEQRGRVRRAVRINKEGGLGEPLMAGQRIGEEFKLVGGWKVRPDGVTTAYDRKAIVQVDPDGSYEFSMAKLNTLMPDDVHVGDVLAWEYVTRWKPETLWSSWIFGGGAPTLVSRFGLKVPDGWTLREHPIRLEGLPGTRDDGGYTVWEMRDLPELPDEPRMPWFGDLRPTIMVAYQPPAGRTDERSIDTWEGVGRWYAGVASSQIVSDATLKRTTAEVAGTGADLMQRIRAITRFTQSLRYLNTAIGRSTSEPHPAPQVLKNRFGDCEDKAILTIAMLREIGVEAFPLLARTRDAGPIIPEFPGVGLFNHAVVVIRLPEEAPSLPAGVDGGPLGRLVVFDPTDSHTGLGDLPSSLQNTLGLVAHTEHGRLVALPTLDPALSSRAAEVSLAMDGAGLMQVKARVVHEGQYAARERWHYGVVRADKRREEVATRLGRHHGKVEVRRLDLIGLEQTGDPLELQIDLAMKPPGRQVGSMRMMPLSFLLPSLLETLPAGERRTPLVIGEGYREAETSRFPLPSGFTVGSDLPSVELSSAAGTYRLKSWLEEGTLVTERELVVRPARVEPAGYTELKRFFDEIARADASTVVLKQGS